nr:two-component regulator propeller domain-containing protein [uncultured Carboxylicivirga sp.]
MNELNRRFFITFLLVSILSVSAYSQFSQYRFESLDTDDGLSNNSVNSILQDSRGYIWFGSYYGLNRYDGYEINTFYHKHDESNTISDNFITSLAEDDEGDIWIGTKFGLNRFHHDTEQISTFYVDTLQGKSITNNQIGALLMDDQNRLWIGTMGGGLNSYNKETNTFEAFQQNHSQYNYINYISALCNGSDDELWMGTYGNGLSLYNKDSEKFKHFSFENMQINSLLDDGLGFIWIATNNMGLYKFSKENHQFIKLNLNKGGNDNINIIMSLSLSQDGKILASIDGDCIYVIDQTNDQVTYNTELAKAFRGLDTKAVYTVYVDGNGLYWIGTIGKGIRLLNLDRNRFTYFTNEPNNPSSLSEDAVISLLQDNKDRIWIGTDGGGLNLFEINSGKFKRYTQLSSNLKSNVIKRLFEDIKGNIWLGTYGGGLALFNPSNGNFNSYNPIEPTKNEELYLSVWSIGQQEANQLWVGTLGNGLFNFDIQSKEFKPLKEIFPALGYVLNDYILSLKVDSKNNLWIGTSNGVYVWYYQTKQYKRWLFDEINNSGVGKNAILTINESRDGNMWLGTNGGGVIIIDPPNGTFNELGIKDGLAQEQVYDIKQDNNNRIWIATQGGISKYDIKTGRFQNFDNRDGLIGSAFNTLMITDSDLIFAGSVKGLNYFNPNITKENAYVPNVQLTNLLINNVPVKVGSANSPLTKNIADTKELVLNHKQNNFGIEFVAINYYSEKNTYSYLLENSSESWSENSTNRIAKYNNLKPGNYTFRVKAANNDGIWSHSETILHIKVLAPWWKRWYAFLAYFLTLGIIIYAYIRYSILWIDLKRKLQFESMESQRIKELNQMRLQFFTNISHEFRTPLTLIAGPLEALRKRLTLDNDDKELFVIMHKNTNLLLRLINQVMDFRKVETGSMELNVTTGDIISFIKDSAQAFSYMASEQKIDFKIKTDIENLVIQFDEDVIEKVIYNLLSNAFKYGKENGEVILSISVEKCDGKVDSNCLLIEVIDDGPGIQADNPDKVFEQYKQFNQGIHKHKPGTGIGLPLAKSLVKLHGGTLNVKSEKGIGTTFTASIPFLIDKREKESQNNQKHFEVPLAIVNPTPNSEPYKEVKHKYTLIIIDDNGEVINYLNSILRNHYNIIKAYDGEQAHKSILNRSVDLIITDVMMPKLNGIELCQLVKNDIQTSHIPVIMLSAKSSVENRIEGISIGADAYLPKPFNPDLLIAYIENLLHSREKLKELFTGNSIIVPSEVTSSGIDEKFVTKALEIVKANMADETFGVIELGNELNMSRSNLHRKLKALTGKSTSDFIRTIRLKEGAIKLISTDLQIAEIAYQVGFNSSSYFIKSFKKEFNMSPGQYKQMQYKWK